MYEIKNEEFTKLVAVSTNWTDLGRRCGVKMNSYGRISVSIISDLKLKVNILGLDTSHFLKNKFTKRSHLQLSRRKIPYEELFIENRFSNGTLLKKRLIQMGWKNVCKPATIYTTTIKTERFCDKEIN